MAYLVKRHGKKEKFDEKKVYASVYSAAINAHYKEKKAEDLAEQVAKKVKSTMRKMGVMDSADIKNCVIEHIPDPHVELLYKHHLDIC